MSIGNTNTYGNKKNNFPYQHAVLQALGELTKESSSDGLARESTLISILNAILTTQQDIEILLVRDTGNANQVVQQITDYSGGAPVVTYKDVNGNIYVPVGPLEYLDSSAVLNLILLELQSIDGKDFATQTTLATVNTSVAAGVRTPNVIRPTGAGTVAPITYSLAVSNVGLANGTFLGAALKPGETLNFDSGGIKNTFAASTFTYDATGTEFIIIYNS
jgi:hypothetical protein